MSISTKINVLNETVQELQEIIPDLFTKVMLNLQALSMIQSVGPSTCLLLKSFSSSLSSSSDAYKKVLHLQLQNFMTEQIYHEEEKNNNQQMVEYEYIFEGLNQNKLNKQMILLQKRGMKLNKKNKALMTQLQMKFQNDIKVSNMEHRKFQSLIQDHQKILSQYMIELKLHQNNLKRKVQKLQWTVFNKQESYKKYLENEDKMEAQLLQKMPILRDRELIQVPINSPKNSQMSKYMVDDLLQMLKEARQQNKDLICKYKDSKDYTQFLSKQNLELCCRLKSCSAQQQKQENGCMKYRQGRSELQVLNVSRKSNVSLQSMESL